MEWELTDEEILAKSTDQFEYCELALEIGKWARDEQAKKLVKHYEGQCTEHWRHTSWYVPRRRCDSCMMELYRQVGL